VGCSAKRRTGVQQRCKPSAGRDEKSSVGMQHHGTEHLRKEQELVAGKSLSSSHQRCRCAGDGANEERCQESRHISSVVVVSRLGEATGKVREPSQMCESGLWPIRGEGSSLQSGILLATQAHLEQYDLERPCLDIGVDSNLAPGSNMRGLRPSQQLMGERLTNNKNNKNTHIHTEQSVSLVIGFTAVEGQQWLLSAPSLEAQGMRFITSMIPAEGSFVISPEGSAFRLHRDSTGALWLIGQVNATGVFEVGGSEEEATFKLMVDNGASVNVAGAGWKRVLSMTMLSEWLPLDSRVYTHIDLLAQWRTTLSWLPVLDGLVT